MKEDLEFSFSKQLELNDAVPLARAWVPLNKLLDSDNPIWMDRVYITWITQDHD